MPSFHYCLTRLSSHLEKQKIKSWCLTSIDSLYCHCVPLPVAHSHISHLPGNNRKRFKTKISWRDKNWEEAAEDLRNDWAEKKVKVTALDQTPCLLWRRINIPKLTLPPFTRHLLGPFFTSSCVLSCQQKSLWCKLKTHTVWERQEIAHMANTVVLWCAHRTHKYLLLLRQAHRGMDFS